MDKKTSFLFTMIVLILMIIFPILINVLMHISIFSERIPVVGEETVWIGALGTFWGAIVGGFISGTLTLFGVSKTIKASFDAIKINAKQQEEFREKEIEFEMLKERLTKLYHPVDTLESSYILKYGSHDFKDLSKNEQVKYIKLLDENSIYGDSFLNTNILELKWAYKERNYDVANKKYTNISKNITDEIIVIREKLNLPKIEY